MHPNFVTQPTRDQICRAMELANRHGHELDPNQSFATQWARIPIVDIPNHLHDGWEQDDAPETRIFFSSGGSTGAPKYTLLTMAEVQTNCEFHGQGYAACGIQATDIVATWGLPGIMSSEFTVYLALAKTGCCILPIGDGVDPTRTLETIRKFHATVLLVMPTDLTILTSHMEKNGERIDSVRLVVTGGEMLYREDRERFRRSLGEQVCFRSVFQTSDTGTIGFQCSYLEGNRYHPHHDLQLLEIVDPDHNGIGDLVTTNLERKLRPVIRARTGDRARKIEGICRCGRATGSIELLGRAGNYVKFGGEKFDLNWLHQLKTDLGVASDDFQVRVERTDTGRDQFVLLSNRVFESENLREKARMLLWNSSRKISQQFETGAIAPLEFREIHENQRIRSSTGKLKFFLDTRFGIF